MKNRRRCSLRAGGRGQSHKYPRWYFLERFQKRLKGEVQILRLLKKLQEPPIVFPRMKRNRFQNSMRKEPRILKCLLSWILPALLPPCLSLILVRENLHRLSGNLSSAWNLQANQLPRLFEDSLLCCLCRPFPKFCIFQSRLCSLKLPPWNFLRLEDCFCIRFRLRVFRMKGWNMMNPRKFDFGCMKIFLMRKYPRLNFLKSRIWILPQPRTRRFAHLQTLPAMLQKFCLCLKLPMKAKLLQWKNRSLRLSLSRCFCIQWQFRERLLFQYLALRPLKNFWHARSDHHLCRIRDKFQDLTLRKENGLQHWKWKLRP